MYDVIVRDVDPDQLGVRYESSMVSSPKTYGHGELKVAADDEIREGIDFDDHEPGTVIATVTLDADDWVLLDWD